MFNGKCSVENGMGRSKGSQCIYAYVNTRISRIFSMAMMKGIPQCKRIGRTIA